MPEAIALTIDSKPLADHLAGLTSAEGLLAVLDTTGPAPEDGWGTWVAEASRSLMLRASADARDGWQGSLLGVVKTTSGASGWVEGLQQAAVEAIRGVMGAVALERAPHGVVANLLVIDDRTTDADLAKTTAYLLDPRYNGYTIGATLRLLQTRTGAGPGPNPGAALITGAAGTIGFATAQAFTEAGYEVVLADLDPERLAQRSEQLGGARTAVLDVTDAAAVHEAVASGRLGEDLAAVVLVHGFQGSAPLEELEAGFIDSSMDVNGTSAYTIVRELLPLLEAGSGGSLVVVSSQCGIRAEPVTAAYCAPKFGLIGLQKGLAAELAARGVTFNTLCPGPVDTAFLRAYFVKFAETEEGKELDVDAIVAERASSLAVGRFAQPEEMGQALRYLAQLEATGVLLAPTGGETLT